MPLSAEELAAAQEEGRKKAEAFLKALDEQQTSSAFNRALGRLEAEREIELKRREEFAKKAFEESRERVMRGFHKEPKIWNVPSQDDINQIEKLQDESLQLQKDVKALRDKKQQKLQDSSPGKFVPLPSSDTDISQLGRRVGNSVIAAVSDTIEDESLPEGFVLDEPNREFGVATTFGYNDPQDNGRGAWGTPTNNPNVVGVALPRKVLRGTFGDEDKAFGALVEVTNPRTGKKITAPIVDKGPADWVIQRQGPTIDLTEGARVALGGTGKDPMEWKIIGHEEPLPEGFTLDEDEPLPEGFALDQPTPAPTPDGDYIDVPGLPGSAEAQAAAGQPAQPVAAQPAQPAAPKEESDFSISKSAVLAQPPAKKEVGLIESAKRGVMSSSLGIGEAVNRYAYSPVVHGISEAIQAVAPESEVAKKAKEFDDAFFKHTVEEPAQMRKKLEFDPETEKRTVAGMDLGKTGEVAGELAELGGALAPDIATAALTQGATAAKAIPTALKTAAPTILNAIKSYAPQLAVGARSFMLPAMKSGMEAQKQAKEEGKSEVDQNAAFLEGTLKTIAMAAVPMAVESKLATRAGRIASRAAQGGTLASATGELERTGSNIVLGENRPFSPVESLKQGVVGGGISVALGRKGVSARKLQQAKATASAETRPTAEVLLLGDERFAPKTTPKARPAPTFEELKKEIHDLWPEAAANNLNPMKDGPWGKPLKEEFDKLPKNRQEKIDKWFEDNDDAITNAAARKHVNDRLRDIRENVDTPREFAFKIVDALRDFPDQKDYIMSGARDIIKEKGWTPPEIETAIKKELVQIYGADAKEMLGSFFPSKTTPQAKAPTPAALPAPSVKPAVSTASGTGIGITVPGTGKFAKTFPAMTAVGKSLKQTVTGIKPWTNFKESLLAWHGRAQRNAQEVKRLHKTIVTAVPDVFRRDGITNYIQADGDLATLQRWEAATSNLKLKQGYRAAQNLTTTELAVVKTVQDTYKDLLKRARHYGIDMNEVQNYVTQMWDMSASGVTTNPTTFSTYFKFSKARTFNSFFEGEQAGFKPKTKDIAEIISIYTDEMNNAINNRMFVEEMGAGKATDGRPLLHPAGLFYTAEKSDGGKTYLSFPDSAKVEAKDYKFIDRPALKKWMWKGQDDAGNPFFQKSDMLVHPEAATQLKRAISGSGLRKWYRGESNDPVTALGKGVTKFLLDEVQPTAKATMLSFSPFHLVQEGIHGFGHTVNPLYNIPKIDLPNNAAQMDAARHGLVLGPTRANQLDFMDGVGMDTKNLVTRGMRKFGGLKGKAGADFLDGTTHWLFEVYIPGLKYKTYQHILERNSKRFADDLGSGKVNIDQIKHLSAEQANAAYGHLNYADLGRNGRSPTVQHFFQIAALAPDFFEARARFVGQSARALAFQKGGMEQFRALAVLAATQWIGARIANTLNNGDPEWEYPFEVRVGNKLYGVRSVPEDLFRLAHDLRAFISGRISPIFGKAVQEGLFGHNWRGEQVSGLEALKDIVFGIIPLPAQTLTRDFYQSGKGMTISPMEQLWAATGLRIHRFSPITEIHRLSGEWQKKYAPQTVTRVAYPISKYAQLRYALEDGDKLKAQHEFQKLRTEGKLSFDKVAKDFETSIKKPFTGSLPNDAKFYQSLNYHDKAKFKAALERRSTIINRFRAWVSPSDKDAVTEAALMNRMLDAQENDEL